MSEDYTSKQEIEEKLPEYASKPKLDKVIEELKELGWEELDE